jgi:hypothetical protein
VKPVLFLYMGSTRYGGVSDKKAQKLNCFLGIRIIRDPNQRKLWFCQDSYIDKMIVICRTLSS